MTKPGNPNLQSKNVFLSVVVREEHFLKTYNKEQALILVGSFMEYIVQNLDVTSEQFGKGWCWVEANNGDVGLCITAQNGSLLPSKFYNYTLQDSINNGGLVKHTGFNDLVDFLDDTHKYRLCMGHGLFLYLKNLNRRIIKEPPILIDLS